MRRNHDKHPAKNPARPIILLDLNHTLANTSAHGTRPERMKKRLEGEQYRQWLVEMIRPLTMVLMTARPVAWTDQTLNRIEEVTGWRSNNACFAPKGWCNPPGIKEHLLRKIVFPIHGEHAHYLAIENNPRSREMNSQFSFPCFWVEAEGAFLTGGTRVPSTPDNSGRPRILHVIYCRESAHAFTEHKNGRKWDRLVLLLRATPPSRKSANYGLHPRTGKPAEPEGSISPMRFGLGRVFSSENPAQVIQVFELVH